MKFNGLRARSSKNLTERHFQLPANRRCENINHCHAPQGNHWLLIAFALLLGQCIGAYQSLSTSVVAGAAFIICVATGCNTRALYAFFCTALCSAWVTAVMSANIYNAWVPSDLESREILVQGKVVGIPSDRINGSAAHWRPDIKFELLLTSPVSQVHEASNLWDATNFRLKLTCYRCELTIETGQSWQLYVKLKRPRGYANQGGFDYEKYLFFRRTVGVGSIKQPQLATLLNEHPSVIDVRARLDRQRSSFLARISAALNKSTDYAMGDSIIIALLLGLKTTFANEHRELLQRLGVSHLMAISGLHVGLIFILVYRIFLGVIAWIPSLLVRVPKQHAAYLPALFAAASYAALAGFSVATQRALVMLCIFTVMRLFARDASLLNVLCLSMIVLLVNEPLTVLDTGFWLSFGAIGVIALWQQRAACIVNNHELDDAQQESRQRLNNLRRFVTELVSLQAAFAVLLTPISILMFGFWSGASFFANLLLIPLFTLLLIPLTLLLGGLALIPTPMPLATDALHLLSASLSQIFAQLELWSSSEWLTHWVADRPFWLSIVLLICVAVAYLQKARNRVTLGVVCIVALFWWQFPVRSSFSVTLLDVGQGLSMVVEAGEYVLVYDTGPRYPSGFTTADAVLIPYLRARGIEQISTLIVSHADNDHIGGLDTLRSHYKITSLLSSRPDRVVGANLCDKGQKWAVNGVRFEIISPSSTTPAGSNNRSCVLRIEYLDKVFLITGDIEKKVEQMLVLAPHELQADVMLVPHQGSKTSSTLEFLQAVQPELGLIAAGYRNHYGHPHPSVVSRYGSLGIGLLSTQTSGQITVSVVGDQFKISQHRQRYARPWR